MPSHLRSPAGTGSRLEINDDDGLPLFAGGAPNAPRNSRSGLAAGDLGIFYSPAPGSAPNGLDFKLSIAPLTYWAGTDIPAGGDNSGNVGSVQKRPILDSTSA